MRNTKLKLYLYNLVSYYYNSSMRTKLWTESDIEFLTINYPIYGNKYCAEKLNKTYSAIKTKASKLNIKAPPKSSGKAKKSHLEYEMELMEREAEVFPIEQYIDYHTAILHSCIEGHNWLLSPASALRGRKCPVCNKTGFDPTSPAILYYIKIYDKALDESFYKVGISNNEVETRFLADNNIIIDILKIERFETGQEARYKEQEILKKYKFERVKVPGLLKRGWTEIFKEDILGLDK